MLRQANIDVVTDLNLQMKHGANLPFSTWIPRRMYVALASDEARTWNVLVYPVLGEPRRHAAAHNTRTGQKQLEVQIETIHGAHQNPTWHTCTDCGSIGRYIMFLFVHC